MMRIYLKKEWSEIGLRFSLGFILLSAVADRFGLWPKDVSAWYNWTSFIEYTATLNPWFPSSIVPFIATSVTCLEGILAIMLFFKIKIRLTTQVGGTLLLLFAIAMSLTTGVKGMLDYGVLPLSFSFFALGYLQEQN